MLPIEYHYIATVGLQHSSQIYDPNYLMSLPITSNQGLGHISKVKVHSFGNWGFTNFLLQCIAECGIYTYCIKTEH